MLRLRNCIAKLLLSAALVTPVVATGCAARVRYYDGYYGDYHRWDDGEVHAYRFWLGERHYQYRDYRDLDRDQQRDYWRWRHEHPGRY